VIAMTTANAKWRKMLNYPIEECLAKVESLMRLGGITFHQKWTCQKCRLRQTMTEPNKFFEVGICEKCGHVSDITKTGCNYLLIASAKHRRMI
jgi:hypothetical protein